MNLAVDVLTGQSYTFVAQAATPPITWRINNIVGGNTTIGTITTGGVYTGPSTVPTPATVTVSGTDNLGAVSSMPANIISAGNVARQRLIHAGGTGYIVSPFTADENTALIQHDRVLLYLIARMLGQVAGQTTVAYNDANWQNYLLLANQIWSANTLTEHFTNLLSDNPSLVTSPEQTAINQMLPTNTSWLNQVNALPGISPYDPTSAVNTGLNNQVNNILPTLPP